MRHGSTFFEHFEFFFKNVVTLSRLVCISNGDRSAFRLAAAPLEGTCSSFKGPDCTVNDIQSPNDAGDPNDVCRSVAIFLRAGQDEQAFAELCKMQERMWRFACTILGNPDDAADAVQEALIRIYLRFCSIEPDRFHFGYVLQTIRHMCINILSKRKRSITYEFVEDLEDHRAESAGDANLRGELIEQATAVLNNLDHSDRMLLVMHHVVGMSHKEIAKVLGVRSGTAKGRCHRARQHFQELWRERYGDESPLDG